MDWKDLDSPRRDLSDGGLKSVVTLLVRWQIYYSCASTGKAIQLNYFYIDYLQAKTPRGISPMDIILS